MLKNNDKIFEHILDNEFTDIFKPIFYILRSFGMHGITIQYKFVTPPTILYKIYCCFIWAVYSTCVVNCTFRCTSRFDTQSTDIPIKAGIVINSFINAYLSWKIVFYSDDTYSQLYVKLQRIERDLKMKGSRKANKKLSNMTSVAAMIGLTAFFALLLLFHVYLINGFCPSATASFAVSSMSYFQMFLVITLLYFLTTRARYVNEQLSRSEDFQENKVYITSKIVKKEMVSDELLRGLCCLLESKADVMDVFQHAILLFTFQLLVWQLISMQNIVVSIKMQMSVNIPSFLCTMTSSVFYVVIMLMMCVASKSLTTTLEITKRLCTKIALSYEGKSKDNAKRMLVLLDGKREATVYDIFTLDTHLPLHLVAITASYTIVLLQFAVL